MDADVQDVQTESFMEICENVSGGYDSGLDEDVHGIEGGASGLLRGEDQRGEHPKRMYVVNRTRTKQMRQSQDGPMTLQPPVSQHFLWPVIQGKFATKQEFLNLYHQAARNAQLVPNSVPLTGNDHNQMHGPGQFCWDIRLMKLLDVKEKDPNDINENMTVGQAITRLRSLHTTLYKAFGINWLQLIRGSQNNDKVNAQKQSIQNRGPSLPLLSIFDEDDLGLNTSWAGQGPWLEGVDEESTLRKILVELQEQGVTKGLVFLTGLTDLVRLAKIPQCLGIRYPQTLEVLDEPNVKRLKIDVRNRKVVVATAASTAANLAVAQSVSTSRSTSSRSPSTSASPSRSASRSNSSKTETTADEDFGDQGDQGGQDDDYEEAPAAEDAILEGQVPEGQVAQAQGQFPQAEGPPAIQVSRRRKLQHTRLSPITEPVRRSIRQSRLRRKQKQIQGGSNESDFFRDWLANSLSPMDSTSRLGSYQRMKSKHLDMISNRRAALFFANRDTGFADLDHLDIDMNEKDLSKASIVTMAFGSSKQLWTSWYLDTLRRGEQAYVVVPTAYDALGSFHKRMEPTDLSQAMPDLNSLLQVQTIFDISPISGHVWSTEVPCWAYRHVEKPSIKHVFAQDLAATKAIKSKNRFYTENPSVYGILCVVNRLRSSPKSSCVEDS